MNKITRNLALSGLLLPAAATFSFSKVEAQNRLTWNLNVPPVERVDSVKLDILDAVGHKAFSDSIALYGSDGNIPTSNITVGGAGGEVDRRKKQGEQ